MGIKRFRTFLNEGGNAVEGVVKIAQENVEATLNTVYTKLLPKLKITKDDIRLLGSTGKKLPGNFSGDIDMAVDINAIVKNNKIKDPKKILPFIASVVKKITPEVTELHGVNIVSSAWPISNTNGKQPDSRVQLDLMLVEKESLDFAAWAYWSPHQQSSKYKGIIRNKLLFSIVREMKFEVLETAYDKKGIEVPSKWKKIFIDSKIGLMKGIQTNIGKSGTVTKTKTTLDKSIVTTDPAEVVKMILGPDFTVADTDSFETLLKAIKSPNFIYKNKVDIILNNFKEDMVNDGYPLPEELL